MTISDPISPALRYARRKLLDRSLWWARCRVTATGGLVSADPVIAALLAPLNRAMEALRDDDADRPPGPREAKVRT